MGASQSKSKSTHLNTKHPLEKIYGVDTGSAGSNWQHDPDWETWENKVVDKNSSHSTTSEVGNENISNAKTFLQKDKEAYQSRDLGEEEDTGHSVIDLEAEEDTVKSVIDLEAEADTDNSVIIIEAEETANSVVLLEAKETTSYSVVILEDNEETTDSVTILEATEETAELVEILEATEETANSVVDQEKPDDWVIDIEAEKDTVNAQNLETEVDSKFTDLQREEKNSEPADERYDNNSNSIIINDEVLPHQRQERRETHEERKERKRKRRERHKERKERKRKRRERHKERKELKRKRKIHEERKERKRKRREWKQSQEYQNSLPITRSESTLGVLGQYEQERLPSTVNGEYGVEKILDRTSFQGVKYFFVKWRGCSTDDNSWEPEENLVDCDDAFHEFMIERRERKRMKRALYYGTD